MRLGCARPQPLSWPSPTSSNRPSFVAGIGSLLPYLLGLGLALALLYVVKDAILPSKAEAAAAAAAAASSSSAASAGSAEPEEEVSAVAGVPASRRKSPKTRTA